MMLMYLSMIKEYASYLIRNKVITTLIQLRSFNGVITDL